MRVAQAVIWGGAIAVLASAPTFAAQTPELVAPARWNAARSAIEVPYQGEAPKPHFFRLAPSHFYYEWGPARCTSGRPQEELMHGVVQRFALANRPDGDVRLAVQTSSAAVPELEIDQGTHTLVLYPTGKPAILGKRAPTPTPAPQAFLPPPPVIPSPSPDDWSEPLRFFTHHVVVVKAPQHLVPPTSKNALLTMLSKPVLDDFHHRLVMSFQGKSPRYAMKTYAKNPRWVYFDFPNASFPLDGSRFDSYSDRVFEAWLLSQRQGGLNTRLYLKLTQAMSVQAKVFPGSHEIWLTAMAPSPQSVPSPAGLPSAAPATASAAAAPLLPAPIATTTASPRTTP